MRNISRQISSHVNFGILLFAVWAIFLSESCNIPQEHKLPASTVVAPTQPRVISTATPEKKILPEVTGTLVPTEKIIIKEVPFERDRWVEYPGITTKGLETVHTFFEVAIGLKGTIWFATTDGVVKFDGSTWKTWSGQGLPHNNWYNIAVDQKGMVWVGGIDVSQFDGQNWEMIPGSKGGINSITVDNHNVIWFGTDSGPVSYDGEKWNNDGTKGDIFKNNEVWDIGFDSKNDMWCVTEKGFVLHRGTMWKMIPANTFWPNYGYGGLAIAPDDSIWMRIGCNITRYKDGSWNNYDVSNLTGGFYEMTIYVSKDGTLWIGGVDEKNYKSILINFDGKEWKRFEDIPIRSIFGIAEDSEGNLWLATGAAVYRYKMY